MGTAAKPSLTRARLKELLHYDPETGVFTRRLNKGRWKAGSVAGCTAKWSRGGVYTVIRVDDVLHLAHRLAWLYVTGEWPSDEIDHIDLNGANNRWANLRAATGDQNKANKPKQSNNTTGFKGVWFHRQIGRYAASINIRGKKHSLGCYATPEEAHAAYRAAAVRAWGEYARY